MGKGRSRRRRKRRLHSKGRLQLDARSRDDVAYAISPSIVSRASVAARFRLLRGRGGVRIAFIPFGLLVPDGDSDELAALALAARTSPHRRGKDEQAAGDDQDSSVEYRSVMYMPRR